MDCDEAAVLNESIVSAMLLIIAIVSNLVAKIPFSFNTTTIFSKKLSKTHLISPFIDILLHIDGTQH